MIRTRASARRKERGMTLIELMLAIVVLMVGIAGAMGLMTTTIGGNWRNQQQSNSTAIAQMVTEKILSQVAGSTATLNINDCAGNNNPVNTAAGGESLLSSGDVDYTATLVANYHMTYTVCGASAAQQSVYDVRWNVQALTNYTNLVTVSAKLQSTGNNAMMFAPVVSIRTVAGQGM